MNLFSIWLPTLGGSILWAIAIGAWFSGQKETGLWFGFAGTICLLLLGALQIREPIVRQREGESHKTDATERAAIVAAEAAAEELRIKKQQLEPRLLIKSAHIEWGPEINQADYVFVIENRGGSDAENVTALAKGVYTYDFGNPKIGDIFLTSETQIPGIIRANSESRFVFPVMGPAVRAFMEQKPREEAGLSKLLQVAFNYDARFSESRTVLVEASASHGGATDKAGAQRPFEVRIIREMPRQPDEGMQYADFFTLPKPSE